MEKFDLDCIVIGGGPAGLTAALYLQRFHRKTLVIDQGKSRVKLAPQIRNLIGYSQGISGRVLLNRLRRQADQYGVRVFKGEGVIFRVRGGFEVRAGADSFFSRFVILATGLQDIQISGIDYRDLCQKRVLAYCPICDGYDHSDKKIAVIIDSENGFRKVKFLSHFSRRLHATVIKNFKISERWQKEMQRLRVRVHQGELQRLNFDCDSQTLQIKLKGQRQFETQVAYLELGAKVPQKAVAHLHGLNKTPEGRFRMSAHQQTSIPGLYAIGDCANSLAQISVAAGEAAIAATAIHNQLSKRRH